MQSLQAQGKIEQAAGIEERFCTAWSKADVTLTASHFMGTGSTTVATSGLSVSGAQPWALCDQIKGGRVCHPGGISIISGVDLVLDEYLGMLPDKKIDYHTPD